jgi:hypothetical protein
MDVKSPFLILLEMLEGLINNFISSFQLIYYKMAELFITLSIISGLSSLGFIAALFFGSVVCFLIIKFVFGSSKEFLYISLFYFLLLVLFSISTISS